MKTTIIIIIFTLSGMMLTAQSSYKKIDADGIANIVFANKTISKGAEASAGLKTIFQPGEAIYARCYFPQAFGKYNARTDEEFVVDVWINGRFVERKLWKHPENDWDQIQVYVANTGDDDFKELASKLEFLDEGENTIMVTVGLERYMQTKDVIGDDGSIRKEKVFTLQILSKATFVIVV
jgi:hypothetical protein